MSSFDVKTINVDIWVAGLSADLAPAFKVITVGVAAEVQSVIAPYPPAPAQGNPWYERGFGRRYRRRDGTVTGRKTSETLGRRWSIASRGAMKAVLMNSASYSAYVHDSEEQTAQHARTGWQTDETAIEKVERSGVITEIAETAISKALKVD